MLAAFKASLQGLGGYGGLSTEKQVDAFSKAISDFSPDQIRKHVSESRVLLTSALKGHPTKSSAWHLAAASTQHGPQLLPLLRELYLGNGCGGLAAQLNATNKRGHTCLHVAAAKGNAACVRWLLEHGAQIHRPDKNGRTPLHEAAGAGCAEAVKLLVAAAEAEDAAAATAAQVAAAAAGPAAAADEAAEAGPKDGCDAGAEGSPVGSPLPRSQSRPRSRSLLPLDGAPASPGSRPSSASQLQAEQLTSVSRLVNARDNCSLTPLHFAAASSSTEAVRVLLAAGASYLAQASVDSFEATMPCSSGWTCLHVAAMRGQYDVADAVLRYHASLSVEAKVATWRPAASRRTSDPRALADRRGTLPATLAAARNFRELAALLDPDVPLAQLDGIHVGPDGQELRPPAMFLCPITQEVMNEPVVAADGFTYEHAAIARWLGAGKLTSPMTNLPFASRLLFPNNVVRTAIKEWRSANHLCEPAVFRSRRPGGAWGGDCGRDAAGLGGGAGGQGQRPAAGGGNDPFLSHLRSHGL